MSGKYIKKDTQKYLCYNVIVQKTLEGITMRLLNYSKKEEGYKHLTYTERLMIERWYNKDRKSKAEIAKLTNKSERTIRREIKRGETIILTTLLEKKKVYSA